MKIKELRERTKLNQTSTAEKIGIPRVNYNKYENEEIEPNIETLCKLADYFNVSLDYLCGRTWNNNIGYIPDDKKELVSLILSLENEQVQDITQMIKGYLFARNKISTGIFDNEGA